MVKIIDLDDFISEDDVNGTDNDTTEEEDDGIEADIDEKSPVPPDPPDPPLFVSAPAASTALEPSGAEATASPSSIAHDVQLRAFVPGNIPPLLRVGSTRHLWEVIAQYNQYLEFQRSIRGHEPIRPPGADGLTRWIIELQERLLNRDLQYACNIRNPFQSNITDEPLTDTNYEYNRDTASEYSVSVTDTAPYNNETTEEAMNKEEIKADSDESTKEKSNGVGKKELLATDTKTDRLSSSEPSDCDLSDVSDSQAPPEYQNMQALLTKEFTSNKEIEYIANALTGCPWSTAKQTCLDAPDPDLMNSMDVKDPSEASEGEGETACLPAHSIVKDCWEQWVDDETLFNLPEDSVGKPSTSTAARTPSPASPTTERRRVKIENRQRALERERATRSQDKSITRFIFVPTEKIGRILGKGGRRIREIEQLSGAKIKVENRQSNKPVTQLTLTGTDKQISKADEKVCIIIRNFKPPRLGEATTASVSSHEEQELKKLLIGIKNQVIDAEKKCRKP